MKRSIARKWAKALESGEYQQGTKVLRKKGNKFCCLGVLCNLHAQEFPDFAKTQKTKKLYDGEERLAPPVVIDWANLSDENPLSPEHEESLAGLNDEGMTFPEIAKIIRKHWKEL